MKETEQVVVKAVVVVEYVVTAKVRKRITRDRGTPGG